jgi:hypothetical protein
MQKQHGAPKLFVDHLRTALALVRNLENGAPSVAALTAQSAEKDQLTALDRWLEGLPDRADLLRQALDVLKRHRQWLPANFDEHHLADYLTARNSLNEPATWLPSHGGDTVDSSEHNLEVAVLATLGEVPWERARQQRLLDLDFEHPRAARFRGLLPPLAHYTLRGASTPARRRARLDAAILKVALRLYQAEKGHPADRLDQLVPRYLPVVPSDPFDPSAPFHYRLSAGEEIVWPTLSDPEATRKLPPGQGVLWISGEDRSDDGGKRRCQPAQRCLAGEDVIFLVPLPAKGPG